MERREAKKQIEDILNTAYKENIDVVTLLTEILQKEKTYNKLYPKKD